MIIDKTQKYKKYIRLYTHNLKILRIHLFESKIQTNKKLIHFYSNLNAHNTKDNDKDYFRLLYKPLITSTNPFISTYKKYIQCKTLQDYKTLLNTLSKDLIENSLFFESLLVAIKNKIDILYKIMLKNSKLDILNDQLEALHESYFYAVHGGDFNDIVSLNCGIRDVSDMIDEYKYDLNKNKSSLMQ
ncbi:hypothetical protein EDEG_02543 [Edhazardia aedis USNM 41457]|uniref:Uncharacterized protein n=1 Tax=Edhazardia aedis (strain USNM 41457) TaxID=1003232 RepID=J9D6D4_EDHAE|nr:hypothetical protein EDEG_02543 [Edhazardia aedis USNM 41457]|eukprot:EJW03064.1 hypothetical protein EDEG_02543 [Edhazardia aedis USNM 41457]